MHEGLCIALLAFFILVWPRLWAWMERVEYEGSMRAWQQLCPTCGANVDKPWAHKTCRHCDPHVWDTPAGD